MPDTLYTIILQVRDAPGVLVRIAHVFARRGCNISSIQVKPHADGIWSDMTIEARNVMRITQIVQQLEKLVDVKSVRVHEDKEDA